MIAGHLGVAGVVWTSRRESSLPWLLGASMAPDVVDGMFVVARACNPYGLYSHTLPAVALIAAVTGLIAYVATDVRATGLLSALLVLVHMPLDYVTGQKLFWPGGELLGLRLYSYPLADFVLEAAMGAGAWWLLRRRRDTPRWATGWAALAVLLALQGTLDAVGARRGGVKPSACAGAPGTG